MSAMLHTRQVVTAENLDDVRGSMSVLDQARELEPGCITWGIQHETGQCGQMTRWPNDRGAACFGGDSVWGDWVTRNGVSVLLTEATTDDGLWIAYDEDGDMLTLDR